MNSTDTARLSILVTITALVGVVMFSLKNQVQAMESELNRINISIQEDVKSIHVLKAEWSHLNSPQRLRNLASKHILLNPARAEQIINYSELPFEYENRVVDRQLMARQNINRQATRNKELKKLIKAQR